MNGFVDIHTHILPGVDDGAQEISDALNLVRMAYRHGTRIIVLTPHYRGKFKENTPNWLRETFSLFSEMVQQEMPDMQLYLGCEVHYEQKVPELLSEKRVLSMNDTHYCLLEFSRRATRSQVITAASETVQHGYTPIIAHAERYDLFREDKTLTDEVLDLGALIQLNADSVLGKHGFRVKWYCKKLLSEGKAHFIASDAHDKKERPPLLRECFLHVHKKYGIAYASQLFEENALKILAGEHL